MTKLHRNYSIRHELDNGNLYVVNRRGDTIGMLWWRPTGKFTVLLEHLEVYPPYQGRGIGTAMQAAFVELFPKLFPKAKYLTAQATSQGVARLLIHILGKPLNRPDLKVLPQKSPQNWIHTKNRVFIRCSVPRALANKSR